MNTPCPVSRALHRCVCSLFRPARVWLMFVWSIGAGFGQSGSTGTITGRIFNPATQQYVRNAEIRVAGTDLVAYSGDDGSYVLTNVPGPDVGLTVTYTGYDV